VVSFGAKSVSCKQTASGLDNPKADADNIVNIFVCQDNREESHFLM
jgi:hypothetical protein